MAGELRSVIDDKGDVVSWLQAHPGIDINEEVDGLTAFYHLLKQPVVPAETVQAFLSYLGIDINGITKKQHLDLPLLYYMENYFIHCNRQKKEKSLNLELHVHVTKVLEMLIGITEDMNAWGSKKDPPLLGCLHPGTHKMGGKRCSMAKVILQCPQVDVNQRDKSNRYTAMSYLLDNDTWNDDIEEIYSLLLDSKLDVNADFEPLYGSSMTLFHRLLNMDIEYKKMDKLKALCMRPDFNPNRPASKETTPLMAVVRKLNSNDLTQYERENLRVLLGMLMENEKTDFNLFDKDGKTAFMIAEDVQVEGLFLSNQKSDINATEPGVKGWNKLRCLLSDDDINQARIEAIVKHHQYDANRVYSDGLTDLIWAVHFHGTNDLTPYSLLQYHHQTENKLPKLLSNDALNVSMPVPNTMTPFCYLAKAWDFNVMKLLVQHSSFTSAALNFVDDKGLTFLHHLCQVKMDYKVADEELEFLKELVHQADINIQDKDGYTPMMRSVANNNNPNLAYVVHCFFTHPGGCHLDKRNIYRQTAADILHDNPGASAQIKSLFLDQLGKKGKSVQEFTVEELVETIRRRISDSRIDERQKDPLQFMLSTFQGVYERVREGGEVGSSEAIRKKLMDNYWYIVNHLDVGEVLTYMFSRQVITENELELIRQQKTRFYRASKLMEILICRDNRCYQAFLEALDVTYQQHITEELTRPVSAPAGEVVAYSPQTLTFPVPLSRKKTITAVTFQFEDNN